MRIAGLQKTSFVDFPKTVSCVIFTPLCNMCCSYCHNKHILTGDYPEIAEMTVFDYLKKRVGVLSGVVISGGEPTLQPDIDRFASMVKGMGYKIKLDTNGTNPEVLKKMCNNGYVDYVAMDLKAPISKYNDICCANVDTEKIKESIAFLKESGIAHEFRTTFCPELSTEDIIEICETLAKDSDFFLQQYRQVEGGMIPHSKEYVEQTAEKLLNRGFKCVVRGL